MTNQIGSLSAESGPVKAVLAEQEKQLLANPIGERRDR